ncbi:substrate-binding periplasmic protein [Spartinivicinus ruber]|uniref:substrate-binding periplasmic protein n=1 Tax=Spartinivicinus ruber TaxID=2683272 RepID=UPI001E337947|nr:transporter substrate-binding domain-containing protein [Spartinivicinus ruber]
MLVLLRPLFLLFMAVLFGRLAFSESLLVVTENWRPFNYMENGELKGVSTKIMKAVLKQAKLSYTIQILPWARAYQLAQTRPNCIIYTIVRIPSREKLFKWVRPLGKGGTTYLYRLTENYQVAPTNLEQAKQYSIATNFNSMDYVWLKNNGFSRIESPPTLKSAINMLHQGHVDLLAFNNISFVLEFKNAGFDPSNVMAVMPLFTTPYYVAASLATSDEIIIQLQEAYDSLLRNNQIQLIN